MFSILTAGAPAGGANSMLLMMIPLVAVFYFFVIRPENKKKKQAEEMRNSITIGEEITTIGGITGKVVHIKDDELTFETGEDRVRICVKKWALSSTASMEAAAAAKKKK